MTDTSPARNAIGSFSAIEARELVVDSPFELGVERRRGAGRARGRPHARPAPGAAADRQRPEQGSPDRQEPSDQIEAVRAWDAVDPVSQLAGESAFDPALRPAQRNVRANEGLHLLCDRRVRLVEWHVTGRADELGL